jgi:hypothetical protein
VNTLKSDSWRYLKTAGDQIFARWQAYSITTRSGSVKRFLDSGRIVIQAIRLDPETSHINSA